MRVRVLGADGGIGKDKRTSCFLIDDDILIDAGTGLGDLDHEAMLKIDHIFLSHIHMDHIACLPLLVDAVMTGRQTPITVHVPGNDRDKLFRHIFNGTIWPNFARIPSPEHPVMRMEALNDHPYEFNEMRLGTLPVNHHGEAVGYWLQGESGKLVFTGDTGPCEAFWQSVNNLTDVRYLLVECSFPNSLEKIALKTGHLTPNLLDTELRQLAGEPAILATHIKPVFRADVLQEISALSTPHEISILERGQEIVL